MKFHEFYNPVKIISGNNALESLPENLLKIGGKRPILITDNGIIKVGLIDKINSAFKHAQNKPVFVFSNTPPDSSVHVVNKIAEHFKQNNCDSIIAVGGGSVIDTAKGVNMVVSENKDNILELTGHDILIKEQKPIAIVPTTSGTGSEVTSVSVISNPDTNEKLLFSSHNMLPDIACLDSRMTLTLPPKITAMTGMDALTHAIETYTCLQKNPISDALAKAAINLISHNIIEAVKNGSNEEARLNMAHGSVLAGIAFSNSMVGAVHSFGHATGAVAHLPHGVTMNIFLPLIMEYNLSKVEPLYKELLLELTDPEYFVSIADENRGQESINYIYKLREELYNLCQLPYNLSQTNIDQKLISEIAKSAINDGSIIVNPLEINLIEANEILNKAWIAVNKI